MYIEPEYALYILEGLQAVAQTMRNTSNLAYLLTMDEDGSTSTEDLREEESIHIRVDKRRKINVNKVENDKSRMSLRERSTCEFNLATLVKQLEVALSKMDANDVMGCDLSKGGLLPLTPRDHCGHCGSTNNSKHAAECSYCQQPLSCKVDYGVLTDALVWGYCFRETNTNYTMLCSACPLQSVIKLLPLARCYQRPDELGSDFYKLQCYFLTHLIYVFSDWGQHSLHRQLFAEEFRFIVENLLLAINELKDPEIVGEFLQCLKILQFTPESDPDLVPMFLLGVKFLISEEKDAGCKGVWTSKSGKSRLGKAKDYDRYHASYCATIALMDYSFSEV